MTKEGSAVRPGPFPGIAVDAGFTGWMCVRRHVEAAGPR